VVISSLMGLGDRPFTIPGAMLGTLGWFIPGIGPLLGVAAVVRNLFDKYVLFLGTEGYNDSINYRLKRDDKGNWITAPGQTLVHELTHVWQGHNQAFAWGYVANSLWNQCMVFPNFNAAYDVTEGAQWRTYDVEPQGRLVERWYRDEGRLPGIHYPADLKRAYITCNIRPGRPYADTIFENTTIKPGRSAGVRALTPAPGTTVTNKPSAAAAAIRGATPVPVTVQTQTTLIQTVRRPFLF
ncbi:MAG TPA: hypothetical protein VGL09_12145, partial [Methylomirabilota bacterium]